jgi:signal transduction histidine kinase
MGEVFRGTNVRDWVLAGALTALGFVLMQFNVQVSDAHVDRAIAEGSMVHTMGSHSPWMIPVFFAATIPVLWWRRSVLAVTGTAIVVMALHVIVFGWVTRCAAGLPLAFVLVFLGALVYERGQAWIVCGLGGVLSFVVVAFDASTGAGAFVLALPVILIVFGVGRAARHRTALNQELKIRDEELRHLRDERAALTVADDRARLSQQLDGLLHERLDQLTAAAESADGLTPAQARALLEAIESSSRQTLDEMRGIVGLLRGGEVALAPAPTVAHLDALLARHQRVGSRLTVTGNPRSLPATVELSAYRIVEHLVTVLADEAGSPIDVAVRFEDDALGIRVSGPLDTAADVKAAIARAKERAKVLGGSLDVKIARGRAGAVAQLPVRG